MPKRSDLPLSREDRDYFEEYLKEYEPYAEDHPALYLDAVGYDPNRQMSSAFKALLAQDDAERARLGLKDGEYLK